MRVLVVDTPNFERLKGPLVIPPFHQPPHNDSGTTGGAAAGVPGGLGVGGGAGGGGKLNTPTGTLGRKAPKGWFHREAQQEEEQLVTKGEIKQLTQIILPANTGTGIQGPFNVSGNGVQLMRSLGLGNPPSVVNGSGTARIVVRLNHESQPWIPMSFIGANNDAQYIAATIAKLWISVIVADAANPIILLITNNAGVSTPDSDSASSYSVPAGAQGPMS